MHIVKLLIAMQRSCPVLETSYCIFVCMTLYTLVYNQLPTPSWVQGCFFKNANPCTVCHPKLHCIGSDEVYLGAVR